MRVALDLSPVTQGDTGVARYTEQLWRALVEQHPELTIEPFVIGRGPYRDDIDVPRSRLPLRVARPLWRVLGRPRLTRLTGQADLLHVTDGVPVPSRLPLVLSVHDVLPITHPHLYSARLRAVSRANVAAARRARMVVTTCQATADAIAEASGISPSAIVVAPPGHRGTVARPNPVGGPTPYILCVGAVTPRKGFQFVARALAERPDLPPVVVAGSDGWRASEVRDEIASLGLGARFRFLGRVSDVELDALFDAATVVCHPSIAEGLGIPCLEAMAFGKAVVAADIPPVREIGGDAVALVPVASPEALAEVLVSLVAAEALRVDLGTRACSRAAEYTWQRMASKIVEAYSLAAV